MSTRTQPESEQTKLLRFERQYRQLYMKEAGRYDRTRFDHQRGHTFSIQEQLTIAALLGLAPGQSVLDVAAGTGRIAAYLAQQGCHVTAFDLTHDMLRQAQARDDDDHRSHLRFAEGNARVLPFASDRFEGVMSIRFLHLFPVALYRPFIVEMWRVLRPGGVLLVQLDSALAGGGVVTWGRELHRRLVRGNKPRYYVWPGQMKSVFAGLGHITVHGFWFAGEYFVRRLHAGSATTLRRFIEKGKRSFLANRVFVRVVKPQVDVGSAGQAGGP